MVTKHQHFMHQEHLEHEHSLYSELVCHFPYAVFSVALSLMILSVLSFFDLATCISGPATRAVWDQLFHSFHFIHIVFAAVGAFLTFARFSHDRWRGFWVSALSATVFCVLSDIVMPYVGGRLLGVNMDLHICFVSELQNILPFLAMGLLTGLIMVVHHTHAAERVTGLWSHFAHILVSSLASSFYLVAHGFSHWAPAIGLVFLVLIVAVVVPCTLSDVVVPLFFATTKAKK